MKKIFTPAMRFICNCLFFNIQLDVTYTLQGNILERAGSKAAASNKTLDGGGRLPFIGFHVTH